jgi:2-methylfumaryl-CoA hydratase
MKLRTGNFFEDFRLGSRFSHATPRTITVGDCAIYIALTGARHVLYCARPVAQALGYREQPVDDLLVFNIAFGKTVPDVSQNAIANLGYADLRFQAPVYAGDTLRAESEVIGLRENANRKSGVVYVRSNAYNQEDRCVLTWARWVMVHKRDAAAPAAETHVPELPAHVAPEALAAPPRPLANPFKTQATGSRDLWEDYAPGERINHPHGMTIDESDHTLAAKLYQNTARVHFDARLMAQSAFGRRLVYGGHVISVCRALSYEGLENALGIAAVNAGSHTHPTFAGDTLYARTEVLEKWELPGRKDVGALRLRLIGFKNRSSDELEQVLVASGKHHADVVLDLDYTVFMARSEK